MAQPKFRFKSKIAIAKSSTKLMFTTGSGQPGHLTDPSNAQYLENKGHSGHLQNTAVAAALTGLSCLQIRDSCLLHLLLGALKTLAHFLWTPLRQDLGGWAKEVDEKVAAQCCQGALRLCREESRIHWAGKGKELHVSLCKLVVRTWTWLC